MRVDRVEVFWDAQHAMWSVRIEADEEVIRRHSDVPKNTDEPTLRIGSDTQRATRSPNFTTGPLWM